MVKHRINCPNRKKNAAGDNNVKWVYSKYNDNGHGPNVIKLGVIWKVFSLHAN